MSDLSYLYIQGEHTNSNQGVIVLPEIFGLNQNIKNIVDRISKELNILSVGLDFYYPIDKKVHDLDYVKDIQSAIELKSKTTAQDFLEIFSQTLDYIQSTYPHITTFAVIGFCFGGRLAFLSGLDKRVTKIFSFYGAGANTQYNKDLTTIESLSKARSGDSSLIIKGFFGLEDQSITQADRNLTKDILTSNGLNYEEFNFTAGHAYFRVGGQNYNEKASLASWDKIKNTFNYVLQ